MTCLPSALVSSRAYIICYVMRGAALSEVIIFLIIRELGKFLHPQSPGEQDMGDAVRPNRASHVSKGSQHYKPNLVS